MGNVPPRLPLLVIIVFVTDSEMTNDCRETKSQSCER